MKTTTQLQKVLSCDCGATARNNTKERGMFLRRHPITPESTDEQIQAHIDRQKRRKAEAETRAAEAKQKALDQRVATAIIDYALAKLLNRRPINA